jgi:hypothetical protein
MPSQRNGRRTGSENDRSKLLSQLAMSITVFGFV